MTHPIWDRHPAVRGAGELTRGERAADRMRNGMGSWGFVFGAIGFLAVWMGVNIAITRAGHRTFDPYPFILLNLVLSCVAALQGAILLIAAKRADQVSAETAQHDLNTDEAAKALLDIMVADFALLRAQHAEQTEQIAAIRALLAAGARKGGVR